jgi:hypothetical protein
MGQRRHNFQQKRNADKDDYRTLNPKQDNQRNRQQQKRPQHWREQRVRTAVAAVAMTPAVSVFCSRFPSVSAWEMNGLLLLHKY